jgi:hypothetical protein
MLLFFSDVISTVGPQGEYPGVLEAAYKNSLTLMMDNKLRSVVRTNLLNAPVFRIRIGSGFNLVTGSVYGSRSRRSKISHKSKKKFRNFMFRSAGCSLLRAEGFFFNLDVLMEAYG